MANIVILAKYAEQVTVGHEDCPRATAPHQGVLLPKMRVVTGDHGPPSRSTHTGFPLETIYRTVSGTEIAALKNGESRFNALLENVPLMSTSVCCFQAVASCAVANSELSCYS